MVRRFVADLICWLELFVFCQNGVMTLHESFWVVTGAAAPVIALTNVVAINDALSVRQTLLMAPYDTWPDDVKAFFAKSQTVLLRKSLIPSAVNLLLQASVLSIALLGLSNGQDLVPTSVIAILEGLGIIICAVAACIVAMQRFKYQWLLEHGKKFPEPPRRSKK